MAKRTSKFNALVNYKCPKCRIGKMYTGRTYSIRNNKERTLCPHCGFRFQIEPGYFYAAMYVSYAMVVVEILFFIYLTYQITQSESIAVYIAVVVTTILALAPFNYRYSRLLLLHYLTPKVKYDPKYEALIKEEERDPE